MTTEELIKALVLGLIMGALVYAVSYKLGSATLWPGTIIAFGLGILNALWFMSGVK